MYITFLLQLWCLETDSNLSTKRSFSGEFTCDKLATWNAHCYIHYYILLYHLNLKPSPQYTEVRFQLWLVLTHNLSSALCRIIFASNQIQCCFHCINFHESIYNIQYWKLVMSSYCLTQWQPPETGGGPIYPAIWFGIKFTVIWSRLIHIKIIF